MFDIAKYFPYTWKIQFELPTSLSDFIGTIEPIVLESKEARRELILDSMSALFAKYNEPPHYEINWNGFNQ